MYDALDSSEIRRIIFKNKQAAGQMIGLARNITATAEAEGLITDTPEFAYSTPVIDALAERIMSVY